MKEVMHQNHVILKNTLALSMWHGRRIGKHFLWAELYKSSRNWKWNWCRWGQI